MTVHLYDTTLRDGTQRRGISLGLEDKLKIAVELDRFGVAYIEGGWPGSNPKDRAFFERIAAMDLEQARVVAFGSTRHARKRAEEDANLRALLEAETPVTALVGKTWPLHVTRVLETTLETNLNMIRDSVAWMKAHGRETVYDAEHFFDGFREDRAYALATLEAAVEGGADWLVLCDTNGGSLPAWVMDAVAEVRRQFPDTALGIHAHNDGELAAANSLAAVAAGCTMIQGTINGYGERCGNANLVSLIPTLQLKLNRPCVPAENLPKLTHLSHFVSEVANLTPDPHAPYVGQAAFAHKGGIHVAAVEKVAESYEHIPPETVGNQRQIVISELSGRGNVRMRGAELGLAVEGREKRVLEKVKELESLGYHFESAEGSFELIAHRLEADYTPPFEVQDTLVISERRPGVNTAEAIVKLVIEGQTTHSAAEGVGPVHALDRALRKALQPHFPQLDQVRLVDYKVRILDPETATRATTRVLIEAAAGDARWGTVGCASNIIDASTQALVDSLECFLVRHNQTKQQGETHAFQTV